MKKIDRANTPEHVGSDYPPPYDEQQHREDELVYVVSREVLLLTDNGAELLGPGDCAGFKGGEPNGHRLQSRSDRDALLHEIGTRLPEGDYGATSPRPRPGHRAGGDPVYE